MNHLKLINSRADEESRTVEKRLKQQSEKAGMPRDANHWRSCLFGCPRNSHKTCMNTRNEWKKLHVGLKVKYFLLEGWEHEMIATN